jgi:hypothetical protein
MATEFAQRPDKLRGLRACLVCKLVKTREQVRTLAPTRWHPPSPPSPSPSPFPPPPIPLVQFMATPCENCPDSHPLDRKPGSLADYVESNTTHDFEGCVVCRRAGMRASVLPL